MKKFRTTLLLLIICIVCLTSFKKNIHGKASIFYAGGISIADVAIVEGNSGQKTVEVTIVLSTSSTGPVTVAYTTKNGSATSGSDYVAATGTVTFTKGERVKKIQITVTGDVVCEPNETFEIVLSDPSGATLSNDIGKITIVNDDCINTRLPTYEVRLSFTGYTTFHAVPPDCPIRSNGKVILSGLVSGNEPVNSDDDIMYTGTMQLDMDMDICSAKRVGGEDKLCGMTVIGSGVVNIELELYFNGPGQDSARGGYIKMENKSGSFLRLVFGSCDQDQMNEEQNMVPNETIASIFNGYELPMLIKRTLRQGRYTVTGEAGETVVEVLRKIQ
jgi:hypothetical protein